MDWSNEVTLIFLKLYEKEPAIWNPRDPQNKNRKVVNDAWLRIQQSLGTECSITDLKKKKESLMATFRPLLNKMNASKKASNSTYEVYTPTWFAFHTMARFLQGIYQPRSITCKEDLVPASDDSEQIGKETNMEDEDLQNAINEGTQTTINEEIQTAINEETSNTIEEETQIIMVENREKNTGTKVLPRSNVFNSIPDRESRGNKRSYMDRIENRNDDEYKIMNTDCYTRDKDECLQFADLLTTKMRRFDNQDRDILMNDIENLVFKAKMRRRAQRSQQLSSNATFGENYYH